MSDSLKSPLGELSTSTLSSFEQPYSYPLSPEHLETNRVRTDANMDLMDTRENILYRWDIYELLQSSAFATSAATAFTIAFAESRWDMYELLQSSALALSASTAFSIAFAASPASALTAFATSVATANSTAFAASAATAQSTALATSVATANSTAFAASAATAQSSALAASAATVQSTALATSVATAPTTINTINNIDNYINNNSSVSNNKISFNESSLLANLLVLLLSAQAKPSRLRPFAKFSVVLPITLSVPAALPE